MTNLTGTIAELKYDILNGDNSINEGDAYNMARKIYHAGGLVNLVLQLQKRIEILEGTNEK